MKTANYRKAAEICNNLETCTSSLKKIRGSGVESIVVSLHNGSKIKINLSDKGEESFLRLMDTEVFELKNDLYESLAEKK